MTASIAHEVNQPLATVVTNANASLRWLSGESPNLAEAREAIRRIIRDGNRGGEIIGRIRALAKKAPPKKDWLDLNEAIGVTPPFVKNCTLRGKVRKRLAPKWTQLAILESSVAAPMIISG